MTKIYGFFKFIFPITDDSVLKDNEKSTCESMENISSRFIYEPTSGLYYDKDTGYYYNAVIFDFILFIKVLN